MGIKVIRPLHPVIVTGTVLMNLTLTYRILTYGILTAVALEDAENGLARWSLYW